MPPPLIAATSISKSFAGVQALLGVTFDVCAGEVHALVGENGAGKSTLIRIMTGAETPDGGALTVADQAVRSMDPATARSLGIAAIYQQPLLFPDLTVAENIALPLEKGAGWRRVRWSDRRRMAAELVARLGTPIDPDRLAGDLSMPEQQLVEIARALGARARVLIMDEPTASLTDSEVTRLLDVVRRLRADGVAIVYISHRLDEVFAIADRITVLRDGASVATRAAAEFDRSALIQAMVGRGIDTIFPKRPIAPGPVILETRGLGSRAAGVRDVSISVRAGEVLGIAGLVGSGRTQLAETLFGLRPADRGEILVRGSRVHVRSAAAAIELGIAYVPEDRRRHAVILEMAVAENTTLAILREVSRIGILDREAERVSAQRYIERLRIKTPSPWTKAGDLSGGNQQKVAVARWLLTKPAVLILDEPTQGVDVASKAEIHAVMQELAESGLALIMISSELPEILGMSDRIAVMRGGMIVGVLTRDEADQHRIMALALHGDRGEARSA